MAPKFKQGLKFSVFQWFPRINPQSRDRLIPGFHVHTRVGTTQCIYYSQPRLPRLPPHTGVQPRLARYDSVIVCGDSRRTENKIGRSRFRSSGWIEPRRAVCVKQPGLVIRVRWWSLNYNTPTRSSDVSVDVKKNKPEEAPASRENASRLRYTGKPATKTGRCPLLAINGALVLGSAGMKQRNPGFRRIYFLPRALTDVWSTSEDRK